MRIHKAGRPAIATMTGICILILIGLYFIIHPLWVFFVICAVFVIFLLLLCCFFRVPHRTYVFDDEGVIAPADGKIVHIEETFENEYLKEKCIQVSIFMSLLNVHVNWYPVGGKICYFKHHPGANLVAWHPKSSEKNERTTIVIPHHDTPIVFRQIAGFIAKRIVCYAHVNKEVQQGAQMGIIKFGSRVDIFLPHSAVIHVTKGQRVKGCQTLIASFPKEETIII